MPHVNQGLGEGVAIVTGGAHNIRRAICFALANSGAAICVNAMASVDVAEAGGIAETRWNFTFDRDALIVNALKDNESSYADAAQPSKLAG